jgi:hypothetical protein
VRAFCDAVATKDPRAHLPDPADSIASHRLTWAAERARRTGTVVDVRHLATARPGSPER